MITRDDARLTEDEIANRVPGSRYEERIYPPPTEAATEVIDDRRSGLPNEVRNNVADPTYINEARVADRERYVDGKVDPAVGYDQPGQLFPTNELNDLRTRWDKAQISFVDEPRTAVKQADELVATVVTRISEQFAAARTELEHQWDRGDDVSTEDLRQALRRYRSFFDRLLAF